MHKLIILCLLLLAVPLAARTKFYGYAERGNQTVITSLTGSSAKAQASYPNCPISVFIDGTSTPATIYSDVGGTVLVGGLVTANSTGYFFFWGDSPTYSVTFLPVGITPWTLTGFGGGGGGSSGGIANARGDGRFLTATVTAATTGLSISGGTLTQADVGKMFVIPGGGGAGLAHSTTIASVLTGTTGTLTAAPATTVTQRAYIATDDTAAIQAALDAAGASGNQTSNHVTLPAGYFGFTTLRLWNSQVLEGAGPNTTSLVRMGVGAGGPAIAMTAGQAASGTCIRNLRVLCNQVGTNLNGIELGTQTPGLTDWALGGTMDNVLLYDSTGWGVRAHVNVAKMSNVWVQAEYPTNQSTAGGMYITGGVLTSTFLNIEGFWPSNFLKLAAGFSNFYGLQVEAEGSFPTIPLVSIEAPGNSFYGVFISGGTRVGSDLFKIGGAIQFTRINDISLSGPMTFINTVNDLLRSVTVPYVVNATLAGYTNAPINYFMVQTLPTASLPPANANGSMNGQVFIEDTGAGPNWVVYLGNVRYHIVAGAWVGF